MRKRKSLATRALQLAAIGMAAMFILLTLTGVIVTGDSTGIAGAQESAGSGDAAVERDLPADEPSADPVLAEASATAEALEQQLRTLDPEELQQLVDALSAGLPEAATEGEAADEAPAEDEAEATPEEAPAEAEAESTDVSASVVDARSETGSVGSRAISFLGLFGLIGIAFAFSTNRKAIDWKLVGIGVTLQIAFAVFILKTPVGKPIFDAATSAFDKLLGFTNDGAQFLFASYVQNNTINPALINFTFAVLPTIIFFSSLMTVLYHMGVMQRLVGVVAAAMQKTMGTSGSETLSAAANIFVGQTEAPLMVKPFVSSMTMSELMAVMTGGFATVAGGVLALYVGFLSPYFPEIAGHLMAASVMSAPAALVIAKVMWPETDESVTQGAVKIDIESPDANVIDAAARGAGEGLQLALNVAAMILAFVALIALINYLLGLPFYIYHGSVLKSVLGDVSAAGLTLPPDLAATCDITQMKVAPEARLGCIDAIAAAFPDLPARSVVPALTLEWLFGKVFFPIAFLMGVPLEDCSAVGTLLGQKMVVNELYAYLNLVEMIRDPAVSLQPRSIVICTYALCGFANFGSIAIQIGGIGGIAPDRRHDLAKLGIRAMIGGSLAAFMTANVAGILV